MVALHNYLNSRKAVDVRCYITAPTGSGKTVLFTRLLEDLRSAERLPRTLIVVPTKQLQAQTAEELIDQGFGGSIGTQLPGHYRGSQTVRIITYSAFGRLWDKPGWDNSGLQPKDYGMVIFDEAHHLQGEGAQRTLKSKFGHAMQIGFTATPDYDTKRRLGAILPDEIYGISTAEGIREGLIAPYVSALLTTEIDMSGVRVYGSEYDQRDLDRTINTELRNHVIARFAADVLGERRTQYNVGKVQHAESLAESLRKYGIRAAAVHGHLDTRTINSILAAFHNGEITALCQAQLLGEGFNEKRIEVVVNVRPTLSIVRQKQRVGRGQRTDPDNPEKTLTIIECVDRSYRKMPMLYGAVAGGWHLTPGGLKSQTQDLLDAISGYDAAGVKGITDIAEIEEWWQGPSRFRLVNQAEVLDADRLMHAEGYRAALMPGLDGAVEAPMSRHPAAVGPSSQKSSVNRNHKPKPSWRRQSTRSTGFDDDGGEEQEPIKNARDELESVHDPVVRALTLSVIEEVPVTVDADRHKVRQTLRLLAGTTELSDPDILARYQRLNASLQTDNPNPAELLNALITSKNTDRVNRQYTNRLYSKVPPLRPEGAACVAPQSHDVERLRDHVERFFPERGESTRSARSYCVGCVAVQECLEYAIENNLKVGIWGGTSERERRRLKRVRAVKGDEAVVTAINALWNRHRIPVTFKVKDPEEEQTLAEQVSEISAATATIDDSVAG